MLSKNTPSAAVGHQLSVGLSSRGLVEVVLVTTCWALVNWSQAGLCDVLWESELSRFTLSCSWEDLLTL